MNVTKRNSEEFLIFIHCKNLYSSINCHRFLPVSAAGLNGFNWNGVKQVQISRNVSNFEKVDRVHRIMSKMFTAWGISPSKTFDTVKDFSAIARNIFCGGREFNFLWAWAFLCSLLQIKYSYSKLASRIRVVSEMYFFDNQNLFS